MLTAALIVWLLAGAWLAWALMRQPLPAPAPVTIDPHAADVAEFARAVADWDRG
jgi:hypothetical protein